VNSLVIPLVDTVFTKPHIEYAQLWPMLLVFGVACAGVLVEAFLPRERRYVVQACLAVAGLLAALVGTAFVAADLPDLGNGAARGLIAAEGTIVVDGPTVFFWGLIGLGLGVAARVAGNGGRLVNIWRFGDERPRPVRTRISPDQDSGGFVMNTTREAPASK